MSANPSLRLGIVAPAGPWPRWMAKAVAALGERVVAQFAWSEPGAKPMGLAGHMLGLYSQMDDRVFGRSQDALALADPPPGPPQATLTGTDRDVPIVASSNLDALLWLVDGTPQRALAAATRHGVWTWQHGDGGADPVLRALDQQQTCLATALVVQQADVTRKFPQCVSGLDAASRHRNGSALGWKLSTLVPRTVAGFEQGGWPALDAMAPVDDVTSPPRQSPGILDTLHLGTGLVRRIVGGKMIHALTRPEWLLGVRKRRADNAVWRDDSGFVPVQPPPDRFWADPFVVQHAGTSHLFFEEAPYATEKGVIAWASLGADGTPGPREIVYESDTHLAYPCVFAHDGQMWLVPDNCAAGQVVLLRADAFPRRWVHEAVLLDGVRAVDATLLQHHGRWWVFTNLADAEGSTWDELYLFHAEHPAGPWQPHPQNPIVADVRCARPAGHLFWYHGALVRPAQDCAARYGAAVSFRAVELLTPEAYRERPLGRLAPTWMPGLVGTHTYNADAQFEVVDGLHHRLRR